MNNDILIRRFADLAEISQRQARFTFSPFLSEAELSDFYAVQKNLAPAGVSVFGGYADAERVMLRFGDAETLGWEEPFPIACVKISPLSMKFADDLSHRDVLGAVMHLGMERSELGDILISEKEAYLFATENMAEYICRELTTVRHTSVRCTLTDTLPETMTQKRKIGEIQIAAERADSVISKIHRLSRSESAALFQKELVFVNGRCVQSGSHMLKAGDKVSVRGYGKFRFLGVTGQTRKGNLIAQFELYL